MNLVQNKNRLVFFCYFLFIAAPSRKSWFERAADGVLGSSRNEETSEQKSETSINYSNPISSIHRSHSSANTLSLSSGLTPRQYSSINLSENNSSTNFRDLQAVPDTSTTTMATPQATDRSSSTRKLNKMQFYFPRFLWG